jgi:EAL domain-containing protein (putative c-di-GMP-specific phosphodiesterase class I)
MFSHVNAVVTKHSFSEPKLRPLEIQGQPAPMRDAIHRRLGRATEPQIQFPLIAVFLPAAIWVTLTEIGMDPHLLEIELNESLLIHNVEKTTRILTGLKGLGIKIAVDDFGTGYSSLAMLQRFPLDAIKIDRSLMRGVFGTPDDTGLADAIIAMGKSLSLTVVAQGVETKEQAEHLRLHACDELQGFYFKRPLPVDEFTQLLRDQAAEVTYVGKRLGVAVAEG